MRKVVVIALLVLVVVACLYILRHELAMFIIAGIIPLTDTSVSPLIMLVFWTVIAPTSILAYKIISSATWSLMETVGKVHQRYLNQIYRQQINRSKFINLYSLALLDIARQLPPSSTDTPKLPLRRRFLALPA